MPVLSMLPKGKFNTDVARNTQYIVMFRSPSDRKQVDILADRFFTKHRPKFLDVYERETEKPYGYVLIDNQPGTAKEQQVVCDILGSCHAYPNIIQSSVQPREQTSTTKTLRKKINQPTKELSTKVSTKSPQVKISRKQSIKPCKVKRPRVSRELKALEAYSSEEDSEEYESENSEGEYESESSEGDLKDSESDGDIKPHIIPRRGSGRPGFYQS